MNVSGRQYDGESLAQLFEASLSVHQEHGVSSLSSPHPASRVEGQSAVEYLRTSIIDPNTYIVEGFQPNIMPSNFGEKLTLQDMADLLAFLKTFE